VVTEIITTEVTYCLVVWPRCSTLLVIRSLLVVIQIQRSTPPILTIYFPKVSY